MMRANACIAWGYSDSILYVVHAPVSPEDADWAEFMNEVRTHSVITGVVIVANNGRLKPLQRAEIQRWYQKHNVRGALISGSVVMRGVVTALNWFGVDMRGFAPDDVSSALEFVGVPSASREYGRLLLERLEKAVTAKAAVVAS